VAWTSDLLTGIAVYAAEHGVGEWNPEGIYTADQAGILIARRPPAPDRVIVLDEYLVDDDNTGDATVQLQARFRGAANDPVSAKDLRDDFRDLFNGLPFTRFGGVAVSQMFYTSGATLGFDANDRLELTSNFTIQARHVTALRTD
jgi:hypothetical protein